MLDLNSIIAHYACASVHDSLPNTVAEDAPIFVTTIVRTSGPSG